MDVRLLLLIVADLLFSIQFVFNKIFQKRQGTALRAGFLFSFLSASVFAVVMLFVTGFKIEIEWFSLLMAFCMGCTYVLLAYLSIKALSYTSIATFSLFLMLGGMVVPFLYGILLNGDAITRPKVVCFVIISVALFLNTDFKKEKNTFKAVICFLAVFFINGMDGVISTIHQQNKGGFPIINTFNFMFWCCTIQAVISLILFFIFAKSKDAKINLKDKKSLFSAAGYGLVNGCGNLLVYYSVAFIEPSLQFPIVTGGTVCLSIVMAYLIEKEKPTWKNLVSCALTLAGTIILLFQ